jgi:Fe2+ transport system protein B
VLRSWLTQLQQVKFNIFVTIAIACIATKDFIIRKTAGVWVITELVNDIDIIALCQVNSPKQKAWREARSMK